ncbi:Flp pilus assembly protein CpaB [Phenylobacterium montanum]|uniref:Flp pilus assembly protein CpaB n=1 Tax=Phenylobacterium montanum TaxID=2823693 RepID=A0A975G0Y5_9CAUL|nr:Flp pilus assembly protein CpaB [Caulobacter sp. S6]QUD88584.1 Flp pilus assembly protein CpaB [Caulobacter sp. S6]
MSLRTIASFAIAIFLGLIAVLMVRGVLTSQKGGQSGGAGTAPVVVATKPIDRGVALNPTLLRVVNYPADAVPEGAFQSLDQLVGKTATPRTALRAMGANEPVLASKLTGAGAKVNLSGTISPGMRAVSLRSNDVTGVGGFVLPGDRVDILVTRTAGTGDKASSITQVLAENALVLGVDQTADQASDKPVVTKSVTVEVTPDQAQRISLASSVGQVSLDLRQVTDGAPVQHHVTTVSDLGETGEHHAAPAHRIRKAGPPLGLTEVHVVRGVDSTAYSVGVN